MSSNLSAIVTALVENAKTASVVKVDTFPSDPEEWANDYQAASGAAYPAVHISLPAASTVEGGSTDGDVMESQPVDVTFLTLDTTDPTLAAIALRDELLATLCSPGNLNQGGAIDTDFLGFQIMDQNGPLTASVIHLSVTHVWSRA